MPQVAAELHSRPPFERMMRIHDALKADRYPNCSQLARAIEVSTRTSNGWCARGKIMV